MLQWSVGSEQRGFKLALISTELPNTDPSENTIGTSYVIIHNNDNPALIPPVITLALHRTYIATIIEVIGFIEYLANIFLQESLSQISRGGFVVQSFAIGQITCISESEIISRYASE